MSEVSRGTPPAPAVARGVFASGLPQAEKYAALLADQGRVRGLIGPREVPRLWDRHLLNGAVVGELVPDGSTVVDIGSGAGLPGIPLAIARPDLRVTLVESLLRRTVFLEEVVEQLGLARVDVVRARAEDLAGARSFDVVTSRAVAPLERLARWSLPLARVGGQVVAVKGSSAPEEVAEAAAVIRRLGGARARVVELGAGVSPTSAVVIERLR